VTPDHPAVMHTGKKPVPVTSPGAKKGGITMRKNIVEEMKEYILNEIKEYGFDEYNQIEIDFGGLCEEEEVYQAAKELGYEVDPGEVLGVFWVYIAE
jgi:hypothetical protein